MVGDEGEAPSPLLLAPADEPIARLEMQGRGAPSGQRQPVTPICGDLAQLLADHAITFEIVVRDHEGVVAGGFVGLDQAHEVLQDLRFIGTGLAEAGGRGFGPAREGKKVGEGCSAKSINPSRCNLVPPYKRASCQPPCLLPACTIRGRAHLSA